MKKYVYTVQYNGNYFVYEGEMITMKIAGKEKAFFKVKDQNLSFVPYKLFETHEEATAFANLLRERKKYLGNSDLKMNYFENKFEELKKIYDYVTFRLKYVEGFDHVCFVDVSAGGVYLNGLNSKLPGTYGVFILLPYDLPFNKEMLDNFVKYYIEYYSKQENIDFMKDFIEQGKKYGWD